MFTHKEVAVATLKVIITGPVYNETGQLTGQQELPQAEAERLIELGVARVDEDADQKSAPEASPTKKR